MKTLSRHSDTAKAFTYLLKQWDGLNVYSSNGWVEIDNNIAENALRGVAVGRKNWLFAGSDSGGEYAAVLYSLIGTCRLNNVEPRKHPAGGVMVHAVAIALQSQTGHNAT